MWLFKNKINDTQGCIVILCAKKRKNPPDFSVQFIFDALKHYGTKIYVFNKVKL
jgi:hypothetical protein